MASSYWRVFWISFQNTCAFSGILLNFTLSDFERKSEKIRRRSSELFLYAVLRFHSFWKLSISYVLELNRTQNWWRWLRKFRMFEKLHCLPGPQNDALEHQYMHLLSCSTQFHMLFRIWLKVIFTHIFPRFKYNKLFINLMALSMVLSVL